MRQYLIVVDTISSIDYTVEVPDNAALRKGYSVDEYIARVIESISGDPLPSTLDSNQTVVIDHYAFTLIQM